jgi:hypothetical protein
MFGFNPSQNQAEAGTPRWTLLGTLYKGSGVRLARGAQTYLIGPYHYEDQYGEVRGRPYYPPPVVQFNVAFGGDVPLNQASTYDVPSPWRRKAPG